MYSAGLDAHLKYVSVAVLDKRGKVALETTVSTKEPERLLARSRPTESSLRRSLLGKRRMTMM